MRLHQECSVLKKAVISSQQKCYIKRFLDFKTKISVPTNDTDKTRYSKNE